MIPTNHKYSFRNQDFIAVSALKPTLNTPTSSVCLLDEDWEIIATASDSRLTQYYIADLTKFLLNAFGLSLRVRRPQNIGGYLENPEKKILLLTESDVDVSPLTSTQAGAFYITVTENTIQIVGKTDRGTAQGVYYMEDYMKIYGKNCLSVEEAEHAPRFSPRMTHSGIELDTFSDQFMEAAAHAGMDAIVVYAGTPDTHLHGFRNPNGLWGGSGWGYCDFNNLVWRAAGYGLDVYVYSHFINDKHPDDPDAREYYEESYGRLFRQAPGLKGLVFVGETFEFPSKDPRTCGIRCQLRPKEEKRHAVGWFPCSDYPQMLSFVRDIVKKYNPEVDIVFWTYNWGGAKKEDRLALIEALPKDITLQVTFEMWQYITGRHGRPQCIDDYSISFEGPSQVFIDEAQKAKECGIRLYTMANTGGRTWDNGSAPYLPVPQQWQKRYEALCRAHEEYGLCGVMENHHYGWIPSFLNLFEKNAYMTNAASNAQMLRQIAVRDYGNQAEKALQAWQLFSDGITQIPPAAEEQYGPFRCGPTYPLLFNQLREDLSPFPSVLWAMSRGYGIWNPVYMNNTILENPKQSFQRFEHVSVVLDAFEKGIALLEEAVKDSDSAYKEEITKQLAVARYIKCTLVTTKNVFLWEFAKQLLKIYAKGESFEMEDELYAAIELESRTPHALAEYMHSVANKELENVETALATWEVDSSIGFEASMEYVFSHETANWKRNELNRSLQQLDAFMQEQFQSK